jgi:hypothetical protein
MDTIEGFTVETVAQLREALRDLDGDTYLAASYRVYLRAAHGAIEVEITQADLV